MGIGNPGVGVSGLHDAAARLSPRLLLGALPLGLLGYAASLAVSRHELGIDFRGELYPEAGLLLHGQNPFPAAGASLAGGVNRIFPLPAALLVSPLTALPVGAAAAVFCASLLAALVAALRILGIRDWRVYGAVALWAPTLAALQTGNLSILLLLLVALAWRTREQRVAPGIAIGLAIALKLFLWPLLVWTVALRRWTSSVVAAALAVAGTLLVLPFESLSAYAKLMQNLGATFGPQSYNLTGLLSQSGVRGSVAAGAVSYGAGLTLLFLAYRRESLTLALAAALTLSPIVWLHYFVLLAVPLALRTTRFRPAWLIPAVMILCPENGHSVLPWENAVALTAVAAVTVLAEWPGIGAAFARRLLAPAGVRLSPMRS